MVASAERITIELYMYNISESEVYCTQHPAPLLAILTHELAIDQELESKIT